MCLTGKDPNKEGELLESEDVVEEVLMPEEKPDYLSDFAWGLLVATAEH